MLTLSRYVYGTTRLGDEGIPYPDRVALAQQAFWMGVWIHTSHQYGDALKVLRDAFDEDRSAVPNAIFKIGWSSVGEVRGQVIEQLSALDIPSMAIGQLCPGGELADDLRAGGPSLNGLRKLKEEGLVGSFVMEVWPWTSEVAIDCIRGGHSAGLIDAFIFYLNPLQRFVSNELWDLLLSRKEPIIAMRTVAGGDIRRTRDNPSAPAYLQKRAAQVMPIFEHSGFTSWTEFAARFALGFPQVLATVGATSRVENLREFINAAQDAPALPAEIVRELVELQRRWADDHDRHAAPWSM